MVPKKHRLHLLLILFMLMGISAFVAVNAGTMPITVKEVISVLLGPLAAFFGLPEIPNETAQIILQLRTPRALLAMLSGGALALAGAALQGLFRNPLADPALIGVSSGGAVGAGLVMFLGAKFSSSWIHINGPIGILFAAMLGSICSTYLVYILSKIGDRIHVPTMLLCGIAINALGGAMIGVMLYLADYNTMRDITFWSMGSFARAPSFAVFSVTPIFIIISICILRHSTALNILLLGNAETIHLGYDPHPLQRRIIILCGSVVGLSVALCGTIAFVGLVVPHLARLLVGPNHRFLLPASALGGALLMVVVDTLARSIIDYAELPIGILTAFIGAPFFLYLLLKVRRKEIV
jgi:iron complex transport system permease protein